MCIKKISIKKNKTPGRFLLVQIILCILIIVSIFTEENTIFRDDLNQAKQVRLDAEVVSMKEIVSNTIIRIDEQRETGKERAVELIEAFAETISDSDDPIQDVGNEMNSVCQSQIGRYIQVLIVDGKTYTLLNEYHISGVKVTQAEADALLGQEAVRKTFEHNSCTVHFFVLQSDIDEFVKKVEYKLFHKQQYAEDSYIWVNEVLNMEGGDNYAIRRIHPNLVDTEGEYLSTSMQDSKGNYPYETELEGIRENGEVVHQYYFKNKSNDQIGEKISYAAFYEPFQWIVAMGTPLDRLYADTEKLSEQRITTIMIRSAVKCILVLVLLFLSIRHTITTLSKAIQEAERANKAKSLFLSNMSHDMRTPMNAIIGFTNIAMKHDPKPEVRECLEKINNSSEHLLTLINDVLDFSRIESGKCKLNPVPVDITSVTDVVTDIMQGLLSDRDIDFRVTKNNPKNPYVLADTIRIQEVLVNILSNAVKFTKDGGSICLESDYRPGVDEQHIIVRYQVRDTGVGMSEEFVKHVFDEFVQEENGARTHYKGTGLGMALTKRYVELMGGIITVESKKGIGSTFTVELPMELTAAENFRKQELPVAKTNLTGVKVLMAEDNDLNAEIATIQLEEYGMQVTVASNGKEVVKVFENHPVDTFDVILMDIMMPEMNGYEATRTIRNLDDRPDGRIIPIIALTANAFAEDVQASLDAGMNGHLSKPIMMDEVVKTIARNLGR
ncbi:MAG: response regulator [Oliverpabstia sp.]